MTACQRTQEEAHLFPTHAAYLVPIEIKEIPQYGVGHKGVFAKERIVKGTKLWVWTHRVTSIHHKHLPLYIEKNFGNDRRKIQIFLRQGFVLPPSSSSDTMTPPTTEHNSSTQSDNNAASTTPTNVNTDRKDDFFHSNPTDAGRLTNHSSNPNTGPDGALRDILAGEELTMDYSFHGNPKWYQNICAKYGVLTEAQVAAGVTVS